MAKQTRVYRTSQQTDAMKSVRKPAIKRGQVINPKKYDRKDKSWRGDY